MSDTLTLVGTVENHILARAEGKLSPAEALKHVRALAKAGRVEFASVSMIEALNPLVQRVLDVIADVMKNPRLSRAWVSDLSCVSDFLDHTRSHGRRRRRAQAREIGKRLGVTLHPLGRDPIHEVALALAPDSE